MNIQQINQIAINSVFFSSAAAWFKKIFKMADTTPPSHLDFWSAARCCRRYLGIEGT
jgi:hypothetical protein